MTMASESPVKSQGEPSLHMSVEAQRGSKEAKQELCPRSRPAKSKQQQRPKPYDRSPSASASTCTSSDESNSDGDHDGTGGAATGQHRRQKRIAANSRERKRMHTVNSAFDQLRELVPTYPSNRKLSKIDTLRLACAYINDLTALIRNPTTMHGEDVKLYHEAYMQVNIASPPTPPLGMGYPSAVQVKNECGAAGADYANACSYQHYRIQPPYNLGPADCASSDFSENCASEAENSSPPYFVQNGTCSGIAARPPPFSRTSSDSAAMPTKSNYSHVLPMYHTLSLPPNCSPLVTVQHSVQPSHVSMSTSSQPIAPVWQRTASVPYCLYGQ